MVIFIGGSWGIGHWENHELTGPGVGQYFGFEDVVLNLCQSGDSNIDQLRRLENLFKKYLVDSDDKIYWLVHNPIVKESVDRIYNSQHSLTESISGILSEQLNFADQLAKRHNLYIELIGASCDLNNVSVKQYTNLYVKLPSWGQLLDPSYPASIFSHQADHMLDLKRALEQHRPDLLDEYSLMGGQAFGKRRAMMKLDTMFSSFHPTSLAHKKLKDFLTS